MYLKLLKINFSEILTYYLMKNMVDFEKFLRLSPRPHKDLSLLTPAGAASPTATPCGSAVRPVTPDPLPNQNPGTANDSNLFSIYRF